MIKAIQKTIRFHVSGICNKMKHDLDVDVFLNKTKRIANYIASDPEFQNKLDLIVSLASNSVDKKYKVENSGIEESKQDGGSKTSRIIHHPESQGKRVSFYNKTTGNVACIVNTIKEASKLIGIEPESGWMKLKGEQNIWVKPNWLAREYIAGDTIVEEDKIKFENDLKNIKKRDTSKYKIKVNLFVQKPDQTMVTMKSITEMSKYLNINVKTISGWLAEKKYKDSNGDIDLQGNWKDYKIVWEIIN